MTLPWPLPVGALLALAAGLVAVPLGCALLLLRGDARARVLDRRIASVAVPNRGAAADEPAPPAERSAQGRAAGHRRRLLAALRIEPDRPDLYPAKWWLLLPFCGVAGLAIASALNLLAGRAAWLAAPLLSVLVARAVFGRYRRRHTEALHRQMPEALAMIVRAVRAGMPVFESLRTVASEGPAPTSRAFAQLCDQIFVGLPIETALHDLARRAGTPEYRFFAVALDLQRQTGGNLTDTLENLADIIRRRLRLRARGIALTSEARTSALVLASIPVVAGLAITLINPDYILTFVRDPTGKMVFGLALASLAVGMGAMRLLIRMALS